MVPLGVTGFTTVQLFLVGLAIGFLCYILTGRVFRLMFWSVLLMTVGSFSPLVPWPLDYILFILGHVGLGMFVMALVLALLKLVKIAAEYSPFKLNT